MKEFANAFYHLMTFKRYTIYKRWYEISVGIMAWCSVILLIYTLII